MPLDPQGPSSGGLPTGWASAKDTLSGRVYYVHTRTHETSWEAPTTAGDTRGSQDLPHDGGSDTDNDRIGSRCPDRRMNDSTMPPPPPSSSSTNGPTPSGTTRPTAVTAPAPAATPPRRIMAPPPPRQNRRFGLGDWNRLLQTTNDLALRRGAPLRAISWKEVRQHASKFDGWMVFRNKVYFITPYLAYHPGGEAILVKCLGKDATALFDKYHSWVNLEALIGKLQIGYIDTKASDDDDDDDEEEEATLTMPEQLALSRR